MDASLIGRGLCWYLVFVFSTTCHEAAHAWVAYRGGDLTAYEGGQVSLDPIPHIVRSPFGMVLIPLITFWQSGWMLGWASIPYDPSWGARHPLRQAAMSAAGPAANLTLAALSFLAMRILLAKGVFVAPDSASMSHLVSVVGDTGTRHTPLGFLAMTLSISFYLNVLLGLFNLLPVPPLDGAGILEGLTHRSTARYFAALRENPMISLVGLLVAWKLFDHLAPDLGFYLRLLYPAHVYGRF